MELKELLSGLLSAAYQMDEAGVASLYNEDGSVKDDALDKLKAKDAERIKNVKPDGKKFFDDGYKKAQSEVLDKQEKEFISKTGFKSDKKGIELYLDYAADQAKAGAITEDAVKKHPVFISAIDKLQKEKEDAVKAETEKLTKFQNDLASKEIRTKANAKALEIFDSLKPILSTDPEKAAAQKELFLEKLKDYEIEQQGDIFLVLKDGKVVEDPHGHRIAFDKIVKDTAAKYHDFHKADPRSSAGNGQAKPKDANGKELELPVFKTQEEVNAFIVDKTKPLEARTAAAQAWEQKNSAPATV